MLSQCLCGKLPPRPCGMRRAALACACVCLCVARSQASDSASDDVPHAKQSPVAWDPSAPDPTVDPTVDPSYYDPTIIDPSLDPQRQLWLLQHKMHAQLEQQNEIQQEQHDLVAGLAPLLAWGNRHNALSGCSLDQYTGLLSLCQVMARARMVIPDTEAPENGPSSAPAAESGCNPQTMTTSLTSTQGCTCNAQWFYRGEPRCGCEAIKGSSRSWCIVQAGCSGAHPGPWGSWDYCGDAVGPGGVVVQERDENNKTYGAEILHSDQQWILEPQASFQEEDGPALHAMCETNLSSP